MQEIADTGKCIDLQKSIWYKIITRHTNDCTKTMKMWRATRFKQHRDRFFVKIETNKFVESR